MNKIRKVIGSLKNVSGENSDYINKGSLSLPAKSGEADSSYISYDDQSLSNEASVVNYIDPTINEDINFTKLHKWAFLGDIGKVKKFVKKINIDSEDSEGRTALHLCAYQDHMEILLFFLCEGANAEVHDKDGRTPLFRAVERGNFGIVQMLLQHKVDIDIKDYMDNTLLHVAAQTGSKNITELLLDCGLEYELKNVNGQTPFFLAASNLHIDAVKVLLSHDVDVNVTDKEDATALMVVAKKGSKPLVDILLEAGADLDKRDCSGWNAAAYARYSGHMDLHAYLTRLLTKETRNLNEGFLSFENDASVRPKLIKEDSIEKASLNSVDSWNDSEDDMSEKAKINMQKFMINNDMNSSYSSDHLSIDNLSTNVDVPTKSKVEQNRNQSSHEDKMISVTIKIDDIERKSDDINEDQMIPATIKIDDIEGGNDVLSYKSTSDEDISFGDDKDLPFMNSSKSPLNTIDSESQKNQYDTINDINDRKLNIEIDVISDESVKNLSDHLILSENKAHSEVKKLILSSSQLKDKVPENLDSKLSDLNVKKTSDGLSNISNDFIHSDDIDSLLVNKDNSMCNADILSNSSTKLNEHYENISTEREKPIGTLGRTDTMQMVDEIWEANDHLEIEDNFSSSSNDSSGNQNSNNSYKNTTSLKKVYFGDSKENVFSTRVTPPEDPIDFILGNKNNDNELMFSDEENIVDENCLDLSDIHDSDFRIDENLVQRLILTFKLPQQEEKLNSLVRNLRILLSREHGQNMKLNNVILNLKKREVNYKKLLEESEQSLFSINRKASQLEWQLTEAKYKVDSSSSEEIYNSITLQEALKHINSLEIDKETINLQLKDKMNSVDKMKDDLHKLQKINIALQDEENHKERSNIEKSSQTETNSSNNILINEENIKQSPPIDGFTQTYLECREISSQTKSNSMLDINIQTEVGMQSHEGLINCNNSICDLFIGEKYKEIKTIESFCQTFSNETELVAMTIVNENASQISTKCSQTEICSVDFSSQTELEKLVNNETKDVNDNFKEIISTTIKESSQNITSLLVNCLGDLKDCNKELVNELREKVSDIQKLSEDILQSKLCSFKSDILENKNNLSEELKKNTDVLNEISQSFNKLNNLESHLTANSDETIVLMKENVSKCDKILIESSDISEKLSHSFITSIERLNHELKSNFEKQNESVSEYSDLMKHNISNINSTIKRMADDSSFKNNDIIKIGENVDRLMKEYTHITNLLNELSLNENNLKYNYEQVNLENKKSASINEETWTKNLKSSMANLSETVAENFQITHNLFKIFEEKLSTKFNYIQNESADDRHNISKQLEGIQSLLNDLQISFESKSHKMLNNSVFDTGVIEAIKGGNDQALVSLQSQNQMVLKTIQDCKNNIDNMIKGFEKNNLSKDSDILNNIHQQIFEKKSFEDKIKDLEVKCAAMQQTILHKTEIMEREIQRKTELENQVSTLSHSLNDSFLALKKMGNAALISEGKVTFPMHPKGEFYPNIDRNNFQSLENNSSLIQGTNFEYNSQSPQRTSMNHYGNLDANIVQQKEINSSINDNYELLERRYIERIDQLKLQHEKNVTRICHLQKKLFDRELLEVGNPLTEDVETRFLEEIKRLKDDKKRIEINWKTKQKDMVELKTQITELQAEKQELISDLSLKNSHIIQLKKDQSQQQKIINDLQLSYVDKKLIPELQDKVMDLQNDIENKQSLILNLRERISVLGQEKQSLVKDLAEKSAKQERSITQEQLISEKDVAEQEAIALRKQLQELNATIEDNYITKDRLDSLYEDVQKYFENLFKERQNQLNLIAASEIQNHEYKNKLLLERQNDLNKVIMDLHNKIDSLQSKVSSTEQDCQLWRTRYNTLFEKHNNVDSQVMQTPPKVKTKPLIKSALDKDHYSWLDNNSWLDNSPVEQTHLQNIVDEIDHILKTPYKDSTFLKNASDSIYSLSSNNGLNFQTYFQKPSQLSIQDNFGSLDIKDSINVRKSCVTTNNRSNDQASFTNDCINKSFVIPEKENEQQMMQPILFGSNDSPSSFADSVQHSYESYINFLRSNNND